MTEPVAHRRLEYPAAAVPAQTLLRAMTLVELLVVTGIIVVMIGIAVPAVSAVLRGSQLTQSTQLLGDQLAYARQVALGKNTSVEVRFYQYADPSLAGETVANPSSGRYRAFQLFAVRDTGQAVALGKVQRLLPSIIIDSGSTLSTLSSLEQKKGQDLDPPLSLPNVGYSYMCCRFRFLANGVIKLIKPQGAGTTTPATSANNQLFVTLHHIKDQDRLSNPPANFSTLQIDLANGHLRLFRP